MKRTICMILCAIMLLSLATAALAGPPPQEYMDYMGAVGALPSADNVTEADLAKIEKAEAKRDACIGVIAESLLAPYNEKLDAVRAAWDEKFGTPAGGDDAGVVNPPADDETPDTGDNFMVVAAVLVLSMTAVVALVSKKKAF